MVSWFVKQALMDIARDTKTKVAEPKTREGWAKLMKRLGVKGIHIAERDTQRAKKPKPFGTFVNTWSVEGFISEGLQPAEFGWGTHEKKLPPKGKRHKTGCGAAIYIEQPGADTRVRTWTPTEGAHFGFLVTHNEAISIADYFTVREGRKVTLPPDLPLCLSPLQRCRAFLARDAGQLAASGRRIHVLDENEIADGRDELGVLLYRPQEERLLVRLAALDRGGAQARALSERDRPAGDLRRADRHHLGDREPARRHRRDGRDGLPPLPRDPDALSGPGARRLHGLDAARTPRSRCSRPTSTGATRGSSRIFW